jgi:hypothetical protein
VKIDTRGSESVSFYWQRLHRGSYTLGPFGLTARRHPLRHRPLSNPMAKPSWSSRPLTTEASVLRSPPVLPSPRRATRQPPGGVRMAEAQAIHGRTLPLGPSALGEGSVVSESVQLRLGVILATQPRRVAPPCGRRSPPKTLLLPWLIRQGCQDCFGPPHGTQDDS